MPKFELECMYCGHKWEEHLWSGFTDKTGRKCEHCGDKFIKFKEIESKQNIYYPEEEVDKNGKK